MPARTGKQYLDSLRDGREIWLNGEKVEDVMQHPAFKETAEAIAHLYDLQHEHADIMLMKSPDTGDPVNITHKIPKSKNDLAHIQKAVKLGRIVGRHHGPQSRLPQYHLCLLCCPCPCVGQKGESPWRPKSDQLSTAIEGKRLVLNPFQC